MQQRSQSPVLSPRALRAEIPINHDDELFIEKKRDEIRQIVSGKDKRFLMIVGPCSIHDVEAGYDYAQRLKAIEKKYEQSMVILMRAYFEKPRTVDGWKGLIIDPKVDGNQDIAHGLYVARQFLRQLVQMRLALATEILDPLTALYIEDCICWAAIGARTTQSPIHRYLAAGLPMPVGFKNNTAGSVKSAVHGMHAARHQQSYLGINEDAQACVVRALGNPSTHLVLRGGDQGPNYGPFEIAKATEVLEAYAFATKLLIDCSHGNSYKDHHNQPIVFHNVLSQYDQGSRSILGMMLESHLKAGKQPIQSDKPLTYGVSITDSCIDFDTTQKLLEQAHQIWLKHNS